MEDTIIIDLFFARNETAIKETDKKYGNTLNGLSFGIIGNSEDAEECVSDTYLAVWNQIPPTRPDNYYAYLCRITRNLSYNRFHQNTAKKRNAELVSLEKELCEIIASSDPTPDEIGVGKLIDAFLRTLSKDARYLLIRRYFYGDPLASLSKLTHMSEGSLAMKLLRIRKKLKTYLEKEGFSI